MKVMSMAKTNNEALKYFVSLIKNGKISLDDEGRLWKNWEPRVGWLECPKRAEKETSNGYFMMRTVIKKYKKAYYVMAHRVVWSYYNGDIPEGMEINHIDGNKKNNRINNLELVTPAVNKTHARETGLLNPAIEKRNWRCKLSDQEVSVIKDLLSRSKLSQKEIADYFGVRPNHISRIKTGDRRNRMIVGGDKVTFSKFQEQSKRTLNMGLSQNEQIANYSMGLCGETGEVIDVLKKYVYHGHELDKDKLKEELGDVLFYVSALCSTLGINMEESAIGNVEKLIRRYPEGFSKECSINRAE